MGLYDGYQLANSSQVKQYQGSTLPELTKVSDAMQQRYDADQETTDWVGRFVQGMQAIPGQDKANLVKAFEPYKQKLAALAARPDKENTLREVTMLARDVPTMYAPFAQSLKNTQEYREQLSKDVREGKINQTTAAGMLNMSMHDYKGLQQDPDTGRYSGLFQGHDYVKDINFNERVDKYLDHAMPHSEGWTREQVGDKWIIKKDNKVVDMPAKHIQDIINAGYQSDAETQSWVKQQQDLATYADDYSHLSNDDVVGATPADKAGKGSVPITLGQVLQEYAAKGIGRNQALTQIRRKAVEDNLLGNASRYGMLKYARHDVESGESYKDNPYGLKDYEEKLKDTVIPLTDHVLSVLHGSNIGDAPALEKQLSDLQTTRQKAYQDFQAWASPANNGVRAVDKSGKPVSLLDPNATFYDKNGGDVTSEARDLLDAVAQVDKSSSDLKQLQQKAMQAARYDPSKVPADVQATATAAAKSAAANFNTNDEGFSHLPEAKKQEIKNAAAAQAYHEALKSDPRYKAYNDYFAQNTQDRSIPVGITTFTSTKFNKAATDLFNNTSVNLGEKSGIGGLRWASGPDNGKDLAAGDYDKVIGKGAFIGYGTDAQGDKRMYFKVGNANTSPTTGKSTGQDIIVSRAPFTGMAEQFIREGHSAFAERFISGALKGIASSPNRTMTLPLSEDGLKVKVQEVSQAEKNSLSSAPSTEYKITYYGDNGQEKTITASSLGDAAAHVQAVVEDHVEQSKKHQ